MKGEISDEDLLVLWKFSIRVKRLRKLVAGWKRGGKIKMESPSSLKPKVIGSGLSSDIRLSAALNELRPFMLSSESIYFPNVRNKISRMYVSDESALKQLKGCKKFWKAYDLYNNGEDSSKMRIVFNIRGRQIDKHKQLLECFMYGRYFHDDDNSLFVLENVIEDNLLLYAIAKMELQFAIFTISSFLTSFNKEYVEPVIKRNMKRIDEFKKDVSLV